jgi:hypothetical protein
MGLCLLGKLFDYFRIEKKAPSNCEFNLRTEKPTKLLITPTFWRLPSCEHYKLFYGRQCTQGKMGFQLNAMEFMVCLLSLGPK